MTRGYLSAIAVLGLLMASQTASADGTIYLWKAEGAVNDWDFTEAGNFTGNAAPGANDIVQIPGGVTLAIDPAEHSESWEAMNRLACIDISAASASNPCRFEVTVGSGGDADMLCGFRHRTASSSSLDSCRCGTLVKKGAGVLRLKESSSAFSNYANFTVEGGELWLPQNHPQTGYPYLYVGEVTVAAGATFYVPTAASVRSNFQPNALYGIGTIANGGTQNSWLIPAGAIEFAGQISGKICLYVNKDIALLCPTNTFKGDLFIQAGRTLSAVTFGNDAGGAPSSLGTTTDNGNRIEFDGIGSRLLCLGTERQSTDRRVYGYVANSTPEKPFTLDAGAFGGVTFKGLFASSGTYWYPAYNNLESGVILALDGSNTVECVLDNEFHPWTGKTSGRSYSYYLIKRGTGTWRLADRKPKGFADGLAVEEGTLRVDALNAIGTDGPLGWGTNLTHGVGGAWAEWKAAPYAIALGGKNAASPGTLVHSGSNAVTCTTRPTVVKGYGGLCNESSRPFLFQGISAFSNTAEHVVTLSGDGVTNENTVADLTDALAGTGSLSVTKEGSGLWVLSGNLSFSGDLTVKEGTLVISNPDHYHWFAFTVRENWGRTVKTYLDGDEIKNIPSYEEGFQIIDEIATFDAQGNRNDFGVTTIYQGWQPKTGINPGEATCLRTDARLNGATAVYKFENAFNGKLWNTTQLYVASNFAKAEDENSWVPIVFRLPYDASKVCSYDWVNNSKTNALGYAATPRIVSLSGSCDGQTWEVLNVHTNAGFTSYPVWAIGTGGVSDGAHTTGAPVDTSCPCKAAAAVLPNVGAVSVAPGARLVADGPVEIGNVRVDAAGAGTFDGFAFAADGTLEIENLPMNLQEVRIPAAFSNATGLASMDGWTLRVNGRETSSRIVKVDEDGFTVTRAGLILIVR